MKLTERAQENLPAVTHHSAGYRKGQASPKREGSPARPGWGLHADETNKSPSKNMQTPRFRLQTTHHACPHAGQYVLQASLHITHNFLATFPTCCPTDPIPVKQHQTRWDGYTQTRPQEYDTRHRRWRKKTRSTSCVIHLHRLGGADCI